MGPEVWGSAADASGAVSLPPVAVFGAVEDSLSAQADPPPINFIEQRPTAHMRAQGASERITGATPKATIQLQFAASPPMTRAIATIINPRRLPIERRKTSKTLAPTDNRAEAAVCRDMSIVSIMPPPCANRAMAKASKACPRWKVKRFEPEIVERAVAVPGPQQPDQTAPLVVDRPMNGEIFTAWVGQSLTPTLRKSDTVIMDNLPAHKVSNCARSLKLSAPVCSMSPYSPDCNPIEMMLAKL